METTPAGRLAEAGLKSIVGYQLAQAAITTNHIFRAQVGDPIGLGRVEFTLLMLIRDNPGCTGTRLARALDVTAANVTMSIDRLQARGLVQREPSAADRRSVHLRLSAQGQTLIDAAAERIAAAEAQTLAPLSAAERGILLELLHRVGLCRSGP